MSNETFKLESTLFEIIYGLHYALKTKNKNLYKQGLLALDAINNDYKKLTGKYYIDELKVLDYHSKLWTHF